MSNLTLKISDLIAGSEKCTVLNAEDFKLIQPTSNSKECFSTMRVWLNRDEITCFRLEQHIQRVLNDALTLGLLDLSSPEKDSVSANLEKAISRTLEGFYFEKKRADSRLRVIVRDGQRIELHVSDYVRPWGQDQTIALKSVTGIRPSPRQKTTDISVSNTAHGLALASGTHEALLVSQDNLVLEGAWSNIFWFDRDAQLFTSEHNVLPGITANTICELFTVEKTSIELPSLLTEAKEVFITQSTTGISTVSKIDSCYFEANEQTTALKKRFNEFVSENSTCIAKVPR